MLSAAFMLRKANMSKISATRMMFASIVGQPPISGERNRAMAMAFRRSRNTTHASNTPAASTSKEPMRTL